MAERTVALRARHGRVVTRLPDLSAPVDMASVVRRIGPVVVVARAWRRAVGRLRRAREALPPFGLEPAGFVPTAGVARRRRSRDDGPVEPLALPHAVSSARERAAS